MDPTTPISFQVEADGIGSACFTWAQIVDAIRGGLVEQLEHSLTRQAQLLGLRFVDADGRDTDGPVPGGVVLVGFSTSATTDPAQFDQSDQPDHEEITP